MTSDIKDILKKLDLNKTGRYENHFYVIPLDDSDEYARTYTKLEENAVNTEYPNFATNTNNTTVKVTNYFEIVHKDINYNIFLFANFNTDEYYLKIGEK